MTENLVFIVPTAEDRVLIAGKIKDLAFKAECIVDGDCPCDCACFDCGICDCQGCDDCACLGDCDCNPQ